MTDAFTHYSVLHWALHSPDQTPSWKWMADENYAKLRDDLNKPAPPRSTCCPQLNITWTYDASDTRKSLPKGITVNDKILFDLIQQFGGRYKFLCVAAALRPKGNNICGGCVFSILVPTSVSSLHDVHHYVQEVRAPCLAA